MRWDIRAHAMVDEVGPAASRKTEEPMSPPLANKTVDEDKHTEYNSAACDGRSPIRAIHSGANPGAEAELAKPIC